MLTRLTALSAAKRDKYGEARQLDDVVLLTIDERRLDAEVKVDGGYPHIYGPLPIDAVTDVRAFRQ